jgi:hypothetical protein
MSDFDLHPAAGIFDKGAAPVKVCGHLAAAKYVPRFLDRSDLLVTRAAMRRKANSCDGVSSSSLSKRMNLAGEPYRRMLPRSKMK